MKVDAKIYKGIEYVQVSELPQTQREILAQTINQDLFIKLLVDGKVIVDGGALAFLSVLPSARQIVETVRTALAA